MGLASFSAKLVGNTPISFTPINGLGALGWKYCYDNMNWLSLDDGTTIALNTEGDTVYFKGAGSPNTSDGASTTYDWFGLQGITMGPELKFSGHLNALLNGGNDSSDPVSEGAGNYYTFGGMFGVSEFEDGIRIRMDFEDIIFPSVSVPYQCAEMFRGVNHMVKMPASLSAETLAEYCYDHMFFGLRSVDDDGTHLKDNFFKAVTLAEGCCTSMFSGTDIYQIDEDFFSSSVVTLAPYCFDSMFDSSLTLTSLPENLLPFMELAEACYVQMFATTKITTIPENFLPAVVLAPKCYWYMFAATDSLVDLPAGLLHAKVMAPNCYEEIFADCDNITSIPKEWFDCVEILAEDCFQSMFEDAEKVNEIHFPFKSWEDSSGKPFTLNWVNNVASDGDFYAPIELQENYSVNEIPIGWRFHPIIAKKTMTAIIAGKGILTLHKK